MLNENNNIYIIVIYVVITVNDCKYILLYSSPLNSYLYYYVHWMLDYYYIIAFNFLPMLYRVTYLGPTSALILMFYCMQMIW